MQRLLIILFVLFITNSYSQDKMSSKNKTIITETNLNKTKESISNFLTNENINHSGEILLKSDNKSLFEFIFPSLIAFFVGTLAFFATLISTKRQLKSNKDTLEKQTESSLEIAKLDFRKSVLSANRQAWINELRELISELISLINLNLLDPSSINIEDSKRISFLITKAEFMLNPIKDSEYINSIINLKDVIFDLSMNTIEHEEIQDKIDIVKQNTKTILKTEWERVKDGK